jgi:hypothetical protein
MISINDSGPRRFRWWKTCNEGLHILPPEQHFWSPFRFPPGVGSGDQPLLAQVGGAQSQPNIVISLQ